MEKNRAIHTAQTTSELADANAPHETRRGLDQLAAKISDPDTQLRLASSRTGVVDRPWVKKIGRIP